MLFNIASDQDNGNMVLTSTSPRNSWPRQCQELHSQAQKTNYPFLRFLQYHRFQR